MQHQQPRILHRTGRLMPTSPGTTWRLRKAQSRPRELKLAAFDLTGHGAWKTVKLAVQGSQKRPSRQDLLQALASLEAETQRSGSSGTLADLQGTWRLVFSAPGSIKQWEYLPVSEYVTYETSDHTIALTTDLGPLNTSFLGHFCWDDGENIMTFAFSEVKLKLFGRVFTFSLKRGSLKDWTFFAVQGGLGCVRSGSGPLTLLHRQ